MSRTDKDRPWEIKYEEGHRERKCPEPNCLRCGNGAEAKRLASKARRQEGRERIKEG